MQIKKGQGRIALVGEKITLKFPKFHPLLLIKHLYEAKKDGRFFNYIKSKEEYPGSFKSHFRGWLENRRESRLSQEVSDNIVPTRFSLFGIFNIQDTASDVNIPYGMVYTELSNLIGQNLVFEHGDHTLPGKSNFGLHEGKIKLRDYGERKLPVILKQYGEQLSQVLEETRKNVQDHSGTSTVKSSS